ncbi:MAG: pilin [Candidatus Pacebacteria bacterium]|nr:pilin [Candidatus Paceibacterota bacterium]
MKKIFKNFLLSVLLLNLLLLPLGVFAQDSEANDKSTDPLSRVERIAVDQGPYAPADETTVSAIAGTVVNAFLGILGIIFIILIILAGYKWMMASGNEEQVTKAKVQLKTAIIGLIVVLGSYAIWEFIFSKLIAQTQ